LAEEILHCRVDKADLVHLRLILSASELGLIPFEFALAGKEFPGRGEPLFAQEELPIALSRARRIGPIQYPSWNRPPRTLFIVGHGECLPESLVREHSQAIYGAMAPWLPRGVEKVDPIHKVKNHIKILVDASLTDIREACACGDFTHVHILSNTSIINGGNKESYGLILCEDRNKEKWEVVNGSRLAEAMRPKDLRTEPAKGPNVVCIAACDSANPGGLLSPNSSVAEELHFAGIPWVFACQYPLTKGGSVVLTEILFRRLFAGDHPAAITQEMRRGLRKDYQNAHDWASLVVYSANVPGFETELSAFRRNQALKVKQLEDERQAEGRAVGAQPLQDFQYDAFISYRHCEPDCSFAFDLYRDLKDAGFNVAIDDADFRPEKDFLKEIERCVKTSRYTLAVLSPRYIESGNTEEEAVMTRVLSMQERQERLIPLKIEEVEMPMWMFGIVGLDFTGKKTLIPPMEKLKSSLSRDK
jgi:hypothetical protein